MHKGSVLCPRLFQSIASGRGTVVGTGPYHSFCFLCILRPLASSWHFDCRLCKINVGLRPFLKGREPRRRMSFVCDVIGIMIPLRKSHDD